MYQGDVLKDDSLRYKGIITTTTKLTINEYESRIFVVVMETSTKTCGLASS